MNEKEFYQYLMKRQSNLWRLTKDQEESAKKLIEQGKIIYVEVTDNMGYYKVIK